ncbi:LysR family transcriptional regulator [Cupriavidus necator]|uniref:LysR family transcriptional regulator n=1 Tax=Cupriavidus necator TaxID=106590 RepID=UPI0005B4400F|nr:LysR family transcriptional regulator [Cupriavidus necator]
MDTIPQRHEDDLGLHHLQVLDVLLAERSLTRAARVLNITQPALSKTLAKLRTYFGDPLFVRVALRMEPTPKALALAEPVRGILERMRALRSDHVVFDPATSSRTFSLFVVDAGGAQMLPPLINRLANDAPGVHVQAVNCDAQHIDLWLESGLVDLAIGSFPGLTQGIRRQPLWRERYVAVTRRGHPRLGASPDLAAFIAEQHVLVTAAGTGHEHLSVERAVEATVPVERIVCRVPMFTTAALVACRSDAVALLPMTLGRILADEMGLQLVTPPLALPEIEIAMYWHDRVHRESGNQWIRGVLRELFQQQASAVPEASG